MKFVEEFFDFYGERTIIGAFLSGLIIYSQMFTLFKTLSRNWQTAKKNVSQEKYRQFRSRQFPYIVMFFACMSSSTIASIVYLMSPHKISQLIFVDLVILLIYVYGIFCLLLLEAGFTLFMDCVLCLPILTIIPKYFAVGHSAMICVWASFVFAISGFCLFLWAKYGNCLTKRYLGVSTILDFDDINEKD